MRHARVCASGVSALWSVDLQLARLDTWLSIVGLDDARTVLQVLRVQSNAWPLGMVQLDRTGGLDFPVAQLLNVIEFGLREAWES